MGYGAALAADDGVAGLAGGALGGGVDEDGCGVVGFGVVLVGFGLVVVGVVVVVDGVEVEGFDVLLDGFVRDDVEVLECVDE